MFVGTYVCEDFTHSAQYVLGEMSVVNYDPDLLKKVVTDNESKTKGYAIKRKRTNRFNGRAQKIHYRTDSTK